MNTSLLLCLAVAVGCASAVSIPLRQNLETICAGQPNFLRIASEDSCLHYYQCYTGRPYLMQCPIGTWFSEIEQICSSSEPPVGCLLEEVEPLPEPELAPEPELEPEESVPETEDSDEILEVPLPEELVTPDEGSGDSEIMIRHDHDDEDEHDHDHDHDHDHEHDHDHDHDHEHEHGHDHEHEHGHDDEDEHDHGHDHDHDHEHGHHHDHDHEHGHDHDHDHEHGHDHDHDHDEGSGEELENDLIEIFKAFLIKLQQENDSDLDVDDEFNDFEKNLIKVVRSYRHLKQEEIENEEDGEIKDVQIEQNEQSGGEDNGEFVGIVKFMNAYQIYKQQVEETDAQDSELEEENLIKIVQNEIQKNKESETSRRKRQTEDAEETDENGADDDDANVDQEEQTKSDEDSSADDDSESQESEDVDNEDVEDIEPIPEENADDSVEDSELNNDSEARKMFKRLFRSIA